VIGEGDQRRHLETLIEKLDLKETFDLAGALPEEEVTEHLRKSDLFVLPSIVAPDGQMEGIPVSLMEAMASRLPVISSDISGIPELITDQENGLLVKPEDEAALADAIRFLYERPELRKQMGAAGRRKVEAEFDLRRNVSELGSLLQRSLKPDAGDTEELLEEIKLQIATSLPQNSRPISVVSSNGNFRNGHDSAVLGLTITDGENIEKDVVVKFHRPAREMNSGRAAAETEYEALSFLWPEFEKTDDGLTVPKPLAILPKRAAVVTEKCSGHRLDSLLRFHNLRRSADLAMTFKRVGKWLNKFHMTASCEGSREEVLERLQTEFSRDLATCRSRGFDKALLDDVEEYFLRNKVLLTREQNKVVSQHCDFGPHNIFVDGDEIAVIDFEGIQPGFIYDDLAYFLCLVDLMPAYHLSQRQKRGLAVCFLNGYGTQDLYDPNVLEFYKVPTLIKLAAHNPVFEQKDTAMGALRSMLRLRAYSAELARLIS
jgi:Ser/Thr protein kinase RdoA (MazF antagonist)